MAHAVGSSCTFIKLLHILVNALKLNSICRRRDICSEQSAFPSSILLLLLGMFACLYYSCCHLSCVQPNWALPRLGRVEQQSYTISFVSALKPFINAVNNTHTHTHRSIYTDAFGTTTDVFSLPPSLQPVVEGRKSTTRKNISNCPGFTFVYDIRQNIVWVNGGGRVVGCIKETIRTTT